MSKKRHLSINIHHPMVREDNVPGYWISIREQSHGEEEFCIPVKPGWAFEASNGLFVASEGFPDFSRTSYDSVGARFQLNVRGDDGRHDHRKFFVPAIFIEAVREAVREYNRLNGKSPKIKESILRKRVEVVE